MSIPRELQDRLQRRATAEGITVESLLSRWLQDGASAEDDSPAHAAPEAEGLYTSLQQFNLLLRSFPAFAYRCLHDWHWTMLFITDGCQDVTGYAAEDLINNAKRSYLDIIHPDDREHVQAAILDGVQWHVPFHITYRIITPDDDVRWVWEQGTALPAQSDTPTQLEGIVIDITHSKRTEEALRESEMTYRKLLFNLNAGVVVHAADTSVLLANPNACNLLGLTEAQVMGREAVDPTWAFLRSDNSIMPIEEYPVNQVIRANKSLHNLVVGVQRAAQGDVAWGLVNGFPVYNDAGDIEQVVISFVDITERKQSEEDLRREHNQLNSITETVPVGVLVFDSSGTITFANTQAETILGMPRDSILGHTYNTLTWQINDADGNPIPDAALSFARAKHTRQPVYNAEHTVTRPDGSSVLISVNAMPAFNEEDSVESVVTAFTDITAQRQAEVAAREVAQLKHNLQWEREHNRLVHRIITSLSHDLRTPLSVIATAQGTLSNYYDRMSEDKRREKLDMIQNQLQFVRQMLDNLKHAVRNYTASETFIPTKINLTRLCQVTVEELQQTTARTHHLIFTSSDPVIMAEVDQTHINRILLNLLSNAVKYSPEGSHVRLTLGREDNHVVLSISDEGIGIPPEEIPYIFEASFRSSNVSTSDAGSGLGLSSAKECVAIHNGTIHVESTLNQGTTFTVRLPAAAPRTDVS